MTRGPGLSLPAAIIDRLLRIVLPRSAGTVAIREELREEYARRRSRGAWRALGWYAAHASTVAFWSALDRVRGRPWAERQRVEPLSELVSALRVLRRAPVYSLAVVLTLGLALTTSVTVFTVVRGVLLRDLPYPDADRLVRLDRLSDGSPLNGAASYPDVIDWRERIGALDGIAVHSGHEGTYAAERVAEIWRGIAASQNLLDVLGVSPVIGRGFDTETGEIGAHTIVISHDLWERRFGRDAGIMGRSIELDDESWQVIGVLPSGFAYPRPGVDFVVPVRETSYLTNRGAGYLIPIARLAPGSTLASARQEVSAVVAAIDASTGAWDEGVVVRRYADVQVAPVRRLLWIFMGSVTLVLLVACANVAGLALARTEARRLELAVRSSLGASRTRLLRELLGESMVLALAGGLLGVVGALAGVRVLLASAPADLPRRAAIHVDPAVIIFGALAAVGAGVLFGMLPALRGASSNPAAGVRTAFTRGRSARRLQEALAAVQIAVAVILMSGAALLLRSFTALTSVDPGFRAATTFVVELGLNANRYPSQDAALTFHDALFERVRAIPGVTDVGVSTHLPFSPAGLNVSVVREGEAYVSGEAFQLGMEMTNGGYFETMGLPIVRGRPFLLDGSGPVRQVVVNETAAAALWPGQDPIGQRFSFDVEEGSAPPADSWFTVVGVVPDVRKRALDEDAVPLGYFPLRDFTRFYTFVTGRYFYLTVGTSGDPADLLGPVRQAVAELDPTLPLRSSGTLASFVRDTVLPARFRTLTLGVFAVLAVGVALLGLYGVMAFSVARARREIGVRMALGASVAGVRSGVLARALRVVGMGGAAGLAGALLAGPLLGSVLYQVAPHDPLTLAGVLTIALAGSLLAAYVPAVRASRVDPIRVLRED